MIDAWLDLPILFLFLVPATACGLAALLISWAGFDSLLALDSELQRVVAPFFGSTATGLVHLERRRPQAAALTILPSAAPR